jgi:2,3-bisphosphoglycerate-independent phosphoglycerate mutase
MDADGRWDRVERVHRAILADGVDRADSARRGIEEACALGTTEGLVEPFVVFDYPGVSPVDVALHFNFGADRARELTHALAGAAFTRFSRKGGRAPFAKRYTCMTPCDTSLGLPALFARAPDPSSLPLDVLAGAGRTTHHCAEGAPPVIARAAADAIRGGSYDLVLADFGDPANAARSGPAEALEGVVGQIIEAARSVGGAVIVLGGRDATSSARLFYVNDADPAARLRDDGTFHEIAPTLLDLLGVPRHPDVDGVSLLVR